MKTMYVIRWKSTVNGRAGKGTKLCARSEGQQLVEELNREYPQIHHELIDAELQRSTAGGASDSSSEVLEPMELAETR